MLIFITPHLHKHRLRKPRILCKWPNPTSLMVISLKELPRDSCYRLGRTDRNPAPVSPISVLLSSSVLRLLRFESFWHPSSLISFLSADELLRLSSVSAGRREIAWIPSFLMPKSMWVILFVLIWSFSSFVRFWR